MKLTFKEKYSYGIGALGKDLICGLVGTYLMFYFTDVLTIAPAFVGTLFFVARFWDGINDLGMGIIVDNTKTRWGKFRPWLLVGTLINSVAFVLLFSTFGLEGRPLYIYVAVMYVIYGMTYTIMDIPYWSMLPNLTSDKKEREKISVIPRIFASFAGLLIGAFGLQAVNMFGDGDQKKGFFYLSVGIAVIFIITISITVCNVKEKTIQVKNEEKTGLRKAMKIIFKNDQLLAVIGIILTFNLAMQIVTGFSLYYFKYAVGREALFSVFIAFAGIAEMSGLMLFPKVVSKITRKQVYCIACILPAVGLIGLLISGIIMPESAVLVGISGIILKLGSGFSLGVATVILADVVDYGEYKFGSRNESVTFSCQTLLMKFAMAVSGLLTGFGLSLTGYIPNVEQSQSTINGIRVLMIVVPIILAALSYLIYKKFYKLDEVYYSNMINELEKRKEKKSEASVTNDFGSEEMSNEDGVLVI